MWDDLIPAWRACLEEAWAACCSGSLPIGAIITDADGQIVARGRNRWHDTKGKPGAVFGSRLAHAELNALLAFDFNGLNRFECSLYTTTEPCPLCMGAIYMAGMRSLFFAARDPYAGSTNLLGTTPYLSRKPVVVNGPLDRHMEILVNGLYVGSELLRGPVTHHPSLDILRETQPCAVTLGSRLAGTGLLREWIDECIPVDDMVRRAVLLIGNC